MKKINKKTKKVSAILLSTVSMLLLFGAAQIINRPDFTGKWIINLSKSEFDDSPLYTAPKQLEIKQLANYLEMKQIVIDGFGQDSTMRVKLWMDGKSSEMQTADQRTRIYRTTWSKDDQVMTEDYSSSYSGDSQREEYHTTEQWKLTPDGKGLQLEKHVQVDNGSGYTVKAVYDKQ
jgi:hypothetical protein